MKIAILGTKGIPNNYGGYEQFAEYISARLLSRGHSVTVYSPNNHPFKGKDFNGIQIIRKFNPENILGGAANIIYDYLCLKDALNKDFDVIYEAGYHSVALSYKLLKIRKIKHPAIVTNMDGLEWKRTKWSKWTQGIIKILEQLAINHSPYLIADNTGIQKYLFNKYKVDSFYVPYGANPISEIDKSHLISYNITESNYFVLIARLEPENNIETIVNAFMHVQTNCPLLIIGNHTTKYGKYLKNKFENPRVKFLGGIYHKSKLDTIRFYSKAYLHGHSVGGTNPSLLEAMACQCLIISHKNPFNESVLGKDALYFNNEKDITKHINEIELGTNNSKAQFVSNNMDKIEHQYNWDNVVTQHETLFLNLIEK